MSRFFDQSSSSESETDSENVVIEQKPRPVTKYLVNIENYFFSSPTFVWQIYL